MGSILLLINHREGIVRNKMTQKLWFFAGLTYFVPYCVNIHGQWTSRQRQQ
nr:nitrate/nitrite transporter NrtS [Synechocystis sp. PCC 7338]